MSTVSGDERNETNENRFYNRPPKKVIIQSTNRLYANWWNAISAVHCLVSHRSVQRPIVDDPHSHSTIQNHRSRNGNRQLGLTKCHSVVAKSNNKIINYCCCPSISVSTSSWFLSNHLFKCKLHGVWSSSMWSHRNSVVCRFLFNEFWTFSQPHTGSCRNGSEVNFSLDWIIDDRPFHETNLSSSSVESLTTNCAP